ncbi:DUF6173 family protein [Pseudooceanicola sp. C21-150M6]|uniref:DUF6173 family protein n=1 Tax=Pseudooceanicola sp. C21-150M6 TaxID=3434355 RepID=UPI003D7F6364
MDDKIATSAEAYEADALPRCYDNRPEGEELSTDHVTDKPAKAKSPAEWAYERLILYIQKFEATLDSDHEVAMGFAGGDTGVIRIEGMGFFEPDIVTFYGTDGTGARTQLVQHVTQLSVMLRATPKLVETAEPQRIGFRLRRDLEKTSQQEAEA